MRPSNFDLIRLCAALQVMLVHSFEHLEIGGSSEILSGLQTAVSAFPGVPIFFVLSGLLISRSYERRPVLLDYFRNRALRIYPALWLCFLISISSVAFLDVSCLRETTLVRFFAWATAQVTCAQFFNPEFLRSYGVGVLNGSLWTIPVELQFYVALPIVYAVFGRGTQLRNTPLVLLTVLFLVVNCVFVTFLPQDPEALWYKLLRCSFVPYFWMFLVGVLIQRNLARLSCFFDGRFGYWLVAHVLVILIIRMIGLRAGSNHPFPLVTLSLAGLTMSAGFTFRSLSKRLMCDNDISYGVYIYHMVVINALVQQSMVRELKYVAFVVLVTTGVAFCSWHLIEKRFLNLKHNSQSNPASS